MKTKTAPGGRRVGAVVVLAAILGVAGPAAAVERGVYIALDYGKFRHDHSAAENDAGLGPFLECYVPYLLHSDFSCSERGDVSIGTSSMGRKARGYDLWVGYQFSPWFAVEGAYVEMGRTRHVFSGTIDLGDADLDGHVDGPLPLQGRISFRTRGPAFAAVANLELGDYFSLDARAGFFFAENSLGLDAIVTLPDGPARFPHSQTDSKTSLFYGASANFWITAYVSVRGGFAAYERGSFGDEVKQYFIGVRYSYGY